MIKNYPELKSVLYHEIGHYVLNNGEFDILQDWKILSKNEKVYISEYAKTNFQEDFAETYSAYLTKPQELLSLSEKKYNFIFNIFDGKEYLTNSTHSTKQHRIDYRV